MSESPVTVPVCYRHPSKETYVRCARCERPICPDCMNEASVGHQCPECVAEGRRTQRSARTAFGGSAAGRSGTATKVLVGINVFVMIASIMSGGANAVAGGGWGGLLGSDTPLTRWGAVLGGAVYGPAGDVDVHGIAGNGEWYRLITAMFLHYGVLHLLMNMYALWILGRDLERALGPLRFVGLYALAGLGGNVAAYVFSPPNQSTAGASTAVFGLMAAIFVLLKRLKLSVAPILPVIVINVIFTFAVTGVSIAGHLGGLLTGAVVAAILAYAPRAKRNLVQGAGLATVFVLLLMIAIYRTLALL
ncbi:rhomboid family intramembrane serine protease [Couchioplanes caeruleus]|uniref:Rhomboid family intramembrane serine protease n=2 Tax=Couchioplanes caeruleus TaxID=56438 RepID=A0A1K0GTW6_9ACTN|nr:rhomboid family intramembrane serine protease [Couchioplanes caeruleus]OJF12755.1 rhomboid family intramembrane serine protease [Couchioplanes caeruleus subsp. caeruleus]ROP31225.1 membrane associated rhomboid family serine protease [Couchioplanes caeruleus]